LAGTSLVAQNNNEAGGKRPAIKTLIMTLIEFFVLLLIAAVCGGIGQSLAGYDLGGCLVSIIVGFIGAYIGLWLAGKFNLPTFFTIDIGGKAFPVIWAIIGSAILTLIVALLRRAFVGTRRY
jgi:uncharacterized membrane protein YeaQ/YmgE (transglycosylase-associated protein family)